jgi:hypothetical protein
VSRFGDVKERSLFPIISEWIKENRKNPVDFARSCSEECESYVQIVTYDEELGEAANHIENLIGALKTKSAIPVLLSAYKRLDKERFAQLCQWMLVFVVRYSVMGNQDRDGLDNLFFELALYIRQSLPDAQNSAAKQEACLTEIKGRLSGNSPTDDQIKSRIEKIEIIESGAKYVIGKIANLVQSGSSEIEIGKASVEHIFPKHPASDKWGGAENHAQLEPLLWNIGNLTMLGRKLNSVKAKNYEYAEKREIYRAESKIIMTQKIAEYYDRWDRDTILLRAKFLTEKALQVWNFSNVSRV